MFLYTEVIILFSALTTKLFPTTGERTNNSTSEDGDGSDDGSGNDDGNGSSADPEEGVIASFTAVVVGVTVSATFLLVGAVGVAFLGAVLCWRRSHRAVKGGVARDCYY